MDTTKSKMTTKRKLIVGGFALFVAALGTTVWIKYVGPETRRLETLRFELDTDDLLRALGNELELQFFTSHQLPQADEPVALDVKDAWGRSISYRRTGRRRFELRSPGADGIVDTSDDLTYPHRE